MQERVKLLQKTSTRDSIGGEVITWVEQDEVWADARPLPLLGREYFAAQQVEAEADMEFHLRYRDDLDATWRVEWRTKQFDIVAPPVDVNSKKQTTQLFCRSVARS